MKSALKAMIKDLYLFEPYQHFDQIAVFERPDQMIVVEYAGQTAVGYTWLEALERHPARRTGST
jgi:hypothetical protein